MISNYQVKYSETEEVLKDICRVNAVDKVMVNHRLTVAVVGFAVACVFVNMTDFFEGNTPLKVLAYIGIWVLAFIGGEILGRTVGIWSAVGQADSEGKQVYKQRVEKWGKPLDIKVEFYDDYFTTWAKGLQKQKVEYGNVSKLIESDETIAIIARNPEEYKSRLYAFPKAGVQGAGADVLCRFIVEKCPGVKKGFKTLKYKHK